jgi:hypothetical protein
VQLHFEPEEPPMRLPQHHFDSSVSEITSNGTSWHVQLIVPREDGTQLNLVGIQTGSLDEAKDLSAKAMRNENPKHTCSPACRVWQEL